MKKYILIAAALCALGVGGLAPEAKADTWSVTYHQGAYIPGPPLIAVPHRHAPMVARPVVVRYVEPVRVVRYVPARPYWGHGHGYDRHYQHCRH